MNEQPGFSADSTGVIRLVGWSDPSNPGTGKTASIPVDAQPAPQEERR
ncbi:MAG: hypothetical protein ACOH19_09235 [Rhodoglobus sp.]